MLRAIDPKSAVPIYRQVMDQVSRAVAAGVLVPGEQLPSVRELAAQLLLNPNTIARVYRDLEREGLVETRRGEGTYIASNASALREAERRRLIAEGLVAVARDAQAFGLSEQEAIGLFREAWQRENPGRKDSR